MNAMLLSLATMGSTLGGGIFALRYRDRMHDLLSFTAGVLLGVVAFEVLPEIFELAGTHALNPRWAMAALVLGFVLFHGLARFIGTDPPHGHLGASRPQVGVLSACALIGHSLMDGVAIGLAFQVSSSVGWSVGIAVITHDFCDGLNTVGLMLHHRNSTRRSKLMLALDAVAPPLGAASTALVQVPESVLTVYLGLFAGFLLYIGAADLLPAAHAGAGTGTALRLIGWTTLGAVFIFAVSRWAA
jgi:ZIP family zinc transporter